MANKNPLKIVVGVVILILILIILGLGFSQKQVNVLTDKIEYANGDTLKVKVANNLNESICFSSCYPYYFERKETMAEWRSYDYSTCPTENLNEKCLEPKQIKAFELVLPLLQKGAHRIAIPACVGCNIQEEFKQDKWFYSNEFTIK